MNGPVSNEPGDFFICTIRGSIDTGLSWRFDVLQRLEEWYRVEYLVHIYTHNATILLGDDTSGDVLIYAIGIIIDGRCSIWNATNCDWVQHYHDHYQICNAHSEPTINYENRSIHMPLRISIGGVHFLVSQWLYCDSRTLIPELP